WTGMLLLLPWAALPPLLADEPKATKQPIEPKLAECTLEVSGQVLKPVSTAVSARREQRASGRRLVIEKDTVTAFREGRAAPDWSVKTADRHHLHWLTADDEMAYFLGYQVDKRDALEKVTPVP